MSQTALYAPALGNPAGAVLAFSPDLSCMPASQFIVSFTAISMEETMTSQVATSCQPGPSVDSVPPTPGRPHRAGQSRGLQQRAGVRGHQFGFAGAPFTRIAVMG